MLQGLDANLLLYLHALLEEEHVGRAAKRSGLSQSGMSRALARLRTHFADELFVSNGRGLRPTPFVVSLRPSLAHSMATLSRVAQARAGFEATSSERRFAIASADYSTQLLLAPLFAHLQRVAPNIDVHVLTLARSIDDVLADDAVDMAIGPPVTARGSITARVLCRDDFCVVARHGHPLLKRRITLSRYSAAAHVLVAPGAQPGSLMDAELASRGRRRRVALRLPSFLDLPAFLLTTDLVATIPRNMAHLYAERWAVDIGELPIPSPRFAVTLSFREEHLSDPGHRWLRDELARIARSPPSQRIPDRENVSAAS